MAKQTITNGQGGASVRSALNSNFTELYTVTDALSTTYVALTGNQTVAGTKTFSSSVVTSELDLGAAGTVGNVFNSLSIEATFGLEIVTPSVVLTNASTNGSQDVLEIAAQGSRPLYIQNFGSEVFSVSAAGAVSCASLLKPGVFTFATLPSASANTGAMLRISDRGQKLAHSDGTDWRFVHDNSVVS